MSTYVGTWFYDTTNSLPDSVTTWRLAIADSNGVPWGTAVSTGWTPTVQVKRMNGAAIIATIVGSWEDASESAALFKVGTASALLPVAGADPIDYEALVVMSKSGTEVVIPASPAGDAYWFRIARWP